VINRWLYVLLAAIVVLGVIFTVWFTRTCSAAHGGYWWCWLG
jgi:hypothetical protein